MLRSFKIGKLFGIPLYIHTTFFLLPVWLLLTNGGGGLGGAVFLMVWIVALFSCVVLHELGHALTARFFGIGTDSITLYPIGGVARLRRMSEKPFEEICIALAGPAVNLVISTVLSPVALFALLSGMQPGVELFGPDQAFGGAVGRLFVLLWISNIMLFLFNLLPCFPMDGGRVLRALLTLRVGQLRATEWAVRIGLVMACLIACLSLVSLSPMPIVLAVFVYFAGQVELMGVRRLTAQRRAAAFAQPVAQEVPVLTEPRLYPDVPFTGIAWDPNKRVWVRWQHGQPIAYWG